MKTILQESALTAAGAKAINEAFRAGGPRRGSGLLQAILDAGFDPRKLSAPAPPPNQAPDARQERREERKTPAPIRPPLVGAY